VADLRVFENTTTTVTIRWTAPGNNGASGQAGQYDVRYSTAPIDEDNWQSASQVDAVPPPQPAGTQESLTVDGLSDLNTYYFCLKALDDSDNWSELSNVVSTDEPRTYLVCSDGSSDFTEIQGAIFHSRDTDIIELCDATYTGSNNRNLNYHGKAITVKSASGNPEDCVIDCEGAGRGFQFDSIEDTLSVVHGVTITNAAGINGGAVYIGHKGGFDAAAPKFVNCVFANSAASSLGGGMYLDDRGTEVILVDCVFVGNTGDGLHLSEDAVATVRGCTFENNDEFGIRASRYSEAIVRDCRFTNNVKRGIRAHESAHTVANSTFDGNHEGGVLIVIAAMTFNNCIFAGNTAVNGGAIDVDMDGQLTLTGCAFTDNSATGRGGAVYCYSFNSLSIEDCTFTGNTAEEGGAVHIRAFYGSGFIPIDFCSFFDNTATVAGGAVYFGGDVVYTRFTNCTFSENTAPSGSAIRQSTYTEVRMYDSIIAYGNGGQAMTCVGTTITTTMNCCDVYQNQGGDWVGCISGQGGVNYNISVDPLFCGGPGSSDLTLRSDSQCATVTCGPMGAFPVGCSP